MKNISFSVNYNNLKILSKQYKWLPSGFTTCCTFWRIYHGI